MNAKDILELAQMLDQAEQFRPAIRAIIDKAHTFGPEIKSAIVPMLKAWLRSASMYSTTTSHLE